MSEQDDDNNRNRGNWVRNVMNWWEIIKVSLCKHTKVRNIMSLGECVKVGEEGNCLVRDT